MRLLLDTHVLLWWMDLGPQLKGKTIDTIRDADEVLVSAASLWETSIKRAKEKLQLVDDFEDRVLASGVVPLPITWEHGSTAGSLPDHHKDPFDRVLIAQAQVEGLTLVTRDSVIPKYDVPLLRA